MKKIAGLSLMALTPVAFPAVVCAQIAEAGEAKLQPTPEIKKLFEAFAGAWDTSGNRERRQFFPNGGERTGRSHIRPGAGGAVLAMEGHSGGTAGPLRHRGLLVRTQAFTLSSPVSKIREAAVKFAAPPIRMGTSS